MARIAYQLPMIQHTTDQNAPITQFDAFMQSQVTLVFSGRVVSQALMDGTWKAYHLTPPANGMDYFSSHMKVEVRPGSELIRIMVSDQDPALATAAGTAIINAYQTLYNEQEKATNRQRINSLDDQERVMESQLKDLSRSRDEYVTLYGSSDLTMFFNAAVQRMLKAEQALDDLKLVQTASGTNPPTAEQIAIHDPAMRTYIDARDQRRDELRRLEAQMPEDNPQVKAARQILADADAKIESFTKVFSENVATLTLQQKKLQLAVTQIGKAKQQCELLDRDIGDMRGQLLQVNERIKTLLMEGLAWGKTFGDFDRRFALGACIRPACVNCRACRGHWIPVAHGPGGAGGTESTQAQVVGWRQLTRQDASPRSSWRWAFLSL